MDKIDYTPDARVLAGMRGDISKHRHEVLVDAPGNACIQIGRAVAEFIPDEGVPADIWHGHDELDLLAQSLHIAGRRRLDSRKPGCTSIAYL